MCIRDRSNGYAQENNGAEMDEQLQSVDSQDTELKHGHSIYCGGVLVRYYVVQYVNKTNRGISSLQRDLIKLRDEYPDKDYTALMKELSLKMR